LIVVTSKAVTWNYPRPSGMDAKNDRAYTWQMAETFKCPHCGALYEVTYAQAAHSAVNRQFQATLHFLDNRRSVK